MLGHAEDAVSQYRRMFKIDTEALCEQIPVCPVCHIELTIDLQAEAVESGEQKKLKKQGILGRLDLTVKIPPRRMCIK
jgi:ferredoxin